MAIERISQGIKTSQVLPQEHKEKIAVYECAKAVVSWNLEHVPTILKLSLIPRSSLKNQWSQYFNKDQGLQLRRELVERISFSIAGRYAEEKILGEISTRCQKDLEKAYEIAQKMVTKLGMSDLGLLSLKDDQYKIYGEYTSLRIDEEIRKILSEAKEIAMRIVDEKIEQIKTLSRKLMEKESISHLEIVEILGEKPFKSKEYEEYFKEEVRKNRK